MGGEYAVLVQNSAMKAAMNNTNPGFKEQYMVMADD